MPIRAIAAFLPLLLALSASAAAEDISWLCDVDQALEIAARDRRPLLMFVTMSECVHCDRMDQKTFSDPHLAAEIRQTCVPVKIDAQQYAGFIKANEIKVFPTLLVVSPDKIEIDRLKGFQTPAQVRQRLTVAQRVMLAEENKTSRR